MKSIQWFLTGLIGLSMMLILVALGYVSGYQIALSRTTPQVITHDVVVTQEVPVEVIKTVEVVKEVLVTPTPEVYSVPTGSQPIVTDIVQITPSPTETPCIDSAWVKMQPISDLEAGALKIGTIKRLHFRILNDGTCIWNDYKLTSGGVLPDIPIPYTQPGEIADIQYDFQVYNPLEARFVVQPPTRQTFGLSNSASPGVGLEPMYYRLDTYQKTSAIEVPYGYSLSCGPFG